MNFFKRWFGRLVRPTPGAGPVGTAGAGPPGPLDRLIGPPESDSLLVALPVGGSVMILDRSAFEYQYGLARGSDPSQAELDDVLARADRVRVLAGGMLRDRPLGTEVLLDTSRRAEVEGVRRLFAVVEDPESFAHCHCLGGPTFEFFAGKERVAALAVHHGRSVRWPRWRHDARLRDPGRFGAWLKRQGVEADPGPSDDPLSLNLLALAEADRHALRADSHRRRGELRQAFDECERALADDPASPLGFGVRGLARREAGRHPEAEADCSEAIRLGLENPEVYLARAVARDALGRPEEALADCDHALKLDPARAAGYNSRAVIRARSGRFVEALADYGKAMGLAPDWPVPAGNRGILHLGIGRFRDAVADLTEAVRRSEAVEGPDGDDCPGGVGDDIGRAAYHAARGEALAALGDDEEALADYHRAVELGPEDPRTILSRGRFLFRQGETDAALADFDEAVRLRPDLRDGYLERAQARAALMEFDEAIADVTEAVRWSPDEPGPYFLRGQLLGQLGRVEPALRDFDRVVALAPENPQGFLLRASCWSHLSRYDSKRADLEEAVRLAPDWPMALNSLAWHLATCPDPAQREGNRAVELARHAVEILPRPEPEFLDTLAAAFAEAGEFGQALAVAREAIALMGDPDRRAVYEARLALYEAGRPYHDPPPDAAEG